MNEILSLTILQFEINFTMRKKNINFLKVVARTSRVLKIKYYNGLNASTLENFLNETSLLQPLPSSNIHHQNVIAVPTLVCATIT